MLLHGFHLWKSAYLSSDARLCQLHHAADPAAALDAVRRKRRHPGDADEAEGGDEAFLDSQGFGEAPPPGNGMLDGDAAAAGYETSDEDEEVCRLQLTYSGEQ